MEKNYQELISKLKEHENEEKSDMENYELLARIAGGYGCKQVQGVLNDIAFEEHSHHMVLGHLIRKLEQKLPTSALVN